MAGLLDLLLGGASVANQMNTAATKGDLQARDRQRAEAAQAQQMQQAQEDRSLSSLLKHSQISENNAHAQQMQAPKAPTAPVLGSPEYMATQEKLEQLKAKYRPKAAPTETPEQRRAAAFQQHKDIREYDNDHPTTTMGGATIKQAVGKNNQQLAVIDDALVELKAHPDAVGLTRGLPVIGSRLDQRVDKQGVGARASIANIGSLQIHDRTGASMTIHEEPRLAPFVPSISDTPEAIEIKLTKLAAGLRKLNLDLGAAPPPQTMQPQQGKAPAGNVDLGASHVTPAERAALKSQGFTDAQINAIKP